MHKTQHFPQLLPNAITALFPDTSYDENSITHVMPERLTTQQNSLFVKGPRLYAELTSEATDANKPLLINALNSYKTTVKTYLIYIQSNGSSDEWNPDNFRLTIQKAKRKSPRLTSTDNG